MKVFAHNCFMHLKITEFLASIDVIPVRMGLHGLNKFRSSIALMARTSHSRSLAPIMVFTVFTLFTNLIHSPFSPLSFSCFFISSFYCALIQLQFPTNSSVTNTSSSHRSNTNSLAYLLTMLCHFLNYKPLYCNQHLTFSVIKPTLCRTS